MNESLISNDWNEMSSSLMLPDSRELLTKERKNVKKSEEKQKRQCIDSSYSERGLSNQLGTRCRFSSKP